MWTHNGDIVDVLPDCVGFVYLITNKTNNRRYIGKKLSHFTKSSIKTVTLKSGVKKKKKVKKQVESDWKTYWSSSLELQNDVTLLGEDNFTREILYYCASKSECTYREASEQFRLKVLESDEFYNGQISCRIHKSHIKNKF
jgi:Putative endonuclease segE, GIY-YIG domain